MARGRMRQEHSDKIQRNYCFLVANVNAKLLCTGLFQRFVLTHDERAEVKNKVECECNAEGMMLLLDKLFQAGHDAYDHFIKCLRDASYHDVISKLEGTNSQSEDLNNTIKNIQGQLEEITNTQSEYEESVLSVKEKIAMFETNFSEQQKSQIVIKKQLAEGKKVSDTHDEEIKSVKEMVKAYGVKLEGCQRTSQSQTEVIKSLEAEIEPIKTTAALVPALQEEQEKMHTKVSALERDAVNCQKTSQSQTEKVELLEERIGSIEAAAALSDTDVRQELQSTAALVADVQQKMDERLSTLEREMNRPRQPEELVKSVHNTILAESLAQPKSTSVERVLGNYRSTLEVTLSCGQSLSPNYGTRCNVNNPVVDMQTGDSSLQDADTVQGEVLANCSMTTESMSSLKGQSLVNPNYADVGINSCNQLLSPRVNVNNSDADIQTGESSLQYGDPLQDEVLNNYRVTIEATPSLEGEIRIIPNSSDVGLQTCSQSLSPEYGTRFNANNSYADMQTGESPMQDRDSLQCEVLANCRKTIEAMPSLEVSVLSIPNSVDVGIETADMAVPGGNIQVTGKTEQETQETFDDLSSETFVKYPDSIAQTQMEATRSRGCVGVDFTDGVTGNDLKLNIFKAVNNQKVANGLVNVGSGDMKLVELEKYIANNKKEGQMVMLISIKSFDGHEIYSYRQKHKNMSLKSLGVENGDSIIYECVG